MRRNVKGPNSQSILNLLRFIFHYDKLMSSVVVFGRNEKNWFHRPGWDCEIGWILNEYVVVEPSRDGFRLKAALRNSRNGFKLEYKYTSGYSTE